MRTFSHLPLVALMCCFFVSAGHAVERDTAYLKKRHPNLEGSWAGACNGKDADGKAWNLPVTLDFINNPPEESGLGRMGGKGYWVLYTPIKLAIKTGDGEGLSTQRKAGNIYPLVNPTLNVCDDEECTLTDFSDNTFGISKAASYKKDTIRIHGETAYRGQYLVLTGKADGNKITGHCEWTHLKKVGVYANLKPNEGRTMREGTFELAKK